MTLPVKVPNNECSKSKKESSDKIHVFLIEYDWWWHSELILFIAAYTLNMGVLIKNKC